MTPFGKLVVTSLLVIIGLSGYGYIRYKDAYQRNANTISTTGTIDTTPPTTSSSTSSPNLATSTDLSLGTTTASSTATTTPGKVAAGYIAGKVTIGPNCPVEQAGKPCTTPPEAYSSREVIIYEKDGVTIREKVKLSSLGIYTITIGPGSYVLQIQPAGIGSGEKKSVTVKSFATSTVDFAIDTGIR